MRSAPVQYGRTSASSTGVSVVPIRTPLAAATAGNTYMPQHLYAFDFSEWIIRARSIVYLYMLYAGTVTVAVIRLW